MSPATPVPSAPDRAEPTSPHDLVEGGTIYSCIVGSRAYGLSGPGSDTDRRGVYLEPTHMFWGLVKPPSHVDGPLAEQFSWELERCCELGLQANPTVLECLWSPIVEHTSPTGDELLGLRRAFLSRQVAQSYGGYARDQLVRLEATRRRTNQVKWKQAMHMLRLLLAGAHVLRTGEVLVDVTSHREELLAVKHGSRPWDDVKALASALDDQLQQAAGHTRLPDEPDRAAINDFLIRTRRANL